MLQTKEYIEKLNEISRHLEKYFDQIVVRESDVASFIFAKRKNLSVEIYQSETFVIVEFWQDEEQIAEKEVEFYEDATELVVDWLKNYEK